MVNCLDLETQDQDSKGNSKTDTIAIKTENKTITVKTEMVSYGLKIRQVSLYSHFSVLSHSWLLQICGQTSVRKEIAIATPVKSDSELICHQYLFWLTTYGSWWWRAYEKKKSCDKSRSFSAWYPGTIPYTINIPSILAWDMLIFEYALISLHVPTSLRARDTSRRVAGTSVAQWPHWLACMYQQATGPGILAAE